MTGREIDTILYSIEIFNILIYFWKTNTFTKYLQHNHETTWIELGKFNFIRNNNPINGLKLLFFMFKRDYLALNDPLLTRHGNQWFLSFITCGIPITVVLILDFYSN